MLTMRPREWIWERAKTNRAIAADNPLRFIELPPIFLVTEDLRPHLIKAATLTRLWFLWYDFQFNWWIVCPRTLCGAPWAALVLYIRALGACERRLMRFVIWLVGHRCPPSDIMQWRYIGRWPWRKEKPQ